MLLSERCFSLLKKRGFAFVGVFCLEVLVPIPLFNIPPNFCTSALQRRSAAGTKQKCSAAVAGGYRLCFRIDTFFTQKMPLMQACAGIMSPLPILQIKAEIKFCSPEQASSLLGGLFPQKALCKGCNVC